jgi:DNA polymerase (family 10)
MIVHNSQIAEIFEQKADLLDIKGANEYRIRAYRNAAQTINRLPTRLDEMIKQGKDLTKLAGIGKDLANKIKEIVETGKLQQLEDLRKELPIGLLKILDIEGLGPKRVKKLYQKLNIKSIKDLKNAIKEKKVQKLEGFGEKTARNIVKALRKFEKSEKRVLLFKAERMIEPLIDYLKKDNFTNKVIVAGSFRRRKETVGDIDILVTSKKGKKVIDRFVNYEEVKNIISQGETKSSVELQSGLQVDLRVVKKNSYGAALIYFTGSKPHNIKLRNLAIDQGYKVSEYGVFKNNHQLAGKTEKEVYNFLGLDYIPPEIREDRGEILAAQQSKLPTLIKLSDLKGDLQMHTKNSDGINSLQEMVEKAKSIGHEYIAITDHSAYLGITQGLEEKDLKNQIKQIKKLNQEIEGITILASIEVDILEDGSLDMTDSALDQLDIVTASVHSKFNLSAKKQTDRIIKAMDNPNVNIIGHPTGRIIGQRDPYKIEIERLLKAAMERNCAMEINAYPTRLDLNDVYAKAAKEIGTKLAINTDAHSVEDLDYLRFGVFQARRGWIEPKDVINTRSLKDLRKLIKRK